ncbi:MAG: hypothetical protein ACSHYC_21965 [Alphaproteobacteria bacterium]
MYDSNITAYTAEKLKTLRLDRAALESDIFDLAQRSDSEMVQNAENHVANVKHQMKLTENSVRNTLSVFAETAHDLEQAKRQFQVENDITRPPKKPDKMLSTLAVTTGAVIESVLTSVSLFADGHVDPVVALGFGTMFALTNTGLGMATGGCSRYLDYKINSVKQRPQYAKTRLLAKTALTSILAVNAVMIVVAGRVRAIGGHEGIFKFSEVGLFETFNDGLGLVIMVAAALSSGVAFFKARTGFSDSCPEYSDYAGTSREIIDYDAEEVVQNTLAELKYLLEDTEDEIVATWALPEDKSDLNEQVVHFKADVQIAKNDVRVFAQAEYERNRFVEGRAGKKPVLDFKEFDVLLTGLDALSFTPPNQEALDALRRVHAETASAILEAHAQYLASVQNNRFLPPHNPTTK